MMEEVSYSFLHSCNATTWNLKQAVPVHIYKSGVMHTYCPMRETQVWERMPRDVSLGTPIQAKHIPEHGPREVLLRI